MRKLFISSDKPELLEGFVAGIEYANDSALEVESFDPQSGVLLLIDKDAEGEDGYYVLTSEGLG